MAGCHDFRVQKLAACRSVAPMFAPVETRDPAAVQREVQSIYFSLFPEGDPFFVPRAFGWVINCFRGLHENYQAIDALYHDLEHTLQGTLCMVRLLRGWHQAHGEPTLTQRAYELGLLAILLHDTGYLKTRDDTEGTGAKYTLTHVERSADFAGRLLGQQGFPEADIAAVQHMIRCTGVHVDLAAIPFASELERLVGYALGSADLLGQMAAEDYIDKLPILYTEFEESQRYNLGRGSDVGTFASADELIRGTPGFYENYVRPKITSDFRGVFRYLNEPYPNGPNEYLHRIEAGLDRLRRRLTEGPAAG
jgi:hypothetical protein